MPAVTVPPRPNGLPIATTQSPTRVAVESPNWTNGRSVASILSSARSETTSRPTSARLIFLAVGQRHGDRDRPSAPPARRPAPPEIDMVVGDDIAVGRDDEARAERGRLARRPGGRRRRCRRRAAELAEQIARTACRRTDCRCCADLDALRGRDVDHRRLQLGGEIGEAHRRAGARRGGGDGAGRVLRDLRADRLLHDQGGGGAAGEHGGGDGIGVTHDGNLLSIVRPLGPVRTLGTLAERVLNGDACRSVAPAPELPQIFVVRRQDHDDAPGASIPSVPKRDPVGLHRPVEIVEVRILAEALGIDAGGLGIGIGADDLRLLGALRRGSIAPPAGARCASARTRFRAACRRAGRRA